MEAYAEGKSMGAEERQALLQTADKNEQNGVRSLLKVNRDADGSIKEDSFLGQLYGDVSSEQFQQMAGTMGASRYELAKQQINDSIGYFNDSESAIYSAYQRNLGGANPAEEDRLHANLRAETKGAQAHQNQDELATADMFNSRNSYQIALHKLTEQYKGIDTDEAGIYATLVGMSESDRKRLKEEKPPIYKTLTTSLLLTGQEKQMVVDAVETGHLPSRAAMDYALGGFFSSADVSMLKQTLNAMTLEERRELRLGYWLHKQGNPPKSPQHIQALRNFDSRYAQMTTKLSKDEVVDTLDAMLSTPDLTELKEDDKRRMAADIMRYRIAEKQSMGGGLAQNFTDTDAVTASAALEFEAEYQAAISDGNVSAEELATPEEMAEFVNLLKRLGLASDHKNALSNFRRKFADFKKFLEKRGGQLSEFESKARKVHAQTLRAQNAEAQVEFQKEISCLLGVDITEL